MPFQNKLILSYPKAGAKLLSNLYSNAGYHDFGAFFDTFRYSIVDTDTLPISVKLPNTLQDRIRKTRHKRGLQIDNWTQTLMTQSRIKKFNNSISELPSIATVNISTFDYTSEAMDLFNNREVLCLRRTDKFNQLISRCMSINEISVPINPEINNAFFEFCFDSLARLERLQTYCVNSGKGRIINLEDLVAGKSSLGFKYSVNKETAPLVVVDNIEELKKTFIKLNNRYNMKWELP